MTPPSRAALYDAFLLSRDRVPGILRTVLSHDAGARWLDAGCGTGQIVAAMADHGLLPEGLDLDAEYLEAARARAPQAPLHHRDLASAGDLGPFDGALVCNGPLCYLPDDDALHRALTALRDALRPGGVLITDTPDLPWILDHYRTPPVQTAVLGPWTVSRRPTHRVLPRVLEHTDTLDFRHDSGATHQTVETFRFTVRTRDALVRAHTQAGFEIRQVWAGWQGQDAGPRVLITARRR